MKKPNKIIAASLVFVFFVTSIHWPAYAQSVTQGQLSYLPKPGEMLHLSPAFNPSRLQGLTIHPEDALKFDFLIQRGDAPLNDAQKKEEYAKLVKYFLASLTIPDENQWVNLSPYEKNRIIKEDFGQTEMGRDLLAQDYILKQITSSLIYPEESLGKEFWKRVYERAYKEYGASDIPVNTFNKVWIIPDEAAVYESGNTVYVLRNHLKVMLEEDYEALSKQKDSAKSRVATRDLPQRLPGDMFQKEQQNVSPSRLPSEQGLSVKASQGNPESTSTFGSQIIRELILPELEREVNEGKNFANLRQIYSGMILATWYKHALKESLLGKIYANQARVKGVDQDPKTNQAIYQQYLKAFKKGVFNYIKEDVNKYTNEKIARKYFSGGAVDFSHVARGQEVTRGFQDGALLVFNGQTPPSSNFVDVGMVSGDAVDRAIVALTTDKDKDKAMIVGVTRNIELDNEIWADALEPWFNEMVGKYPTLVNPLREVQSAGNFNGFLYGLAQLANIIKYWRHKNSEDAKSDIVESFDKLLKSKKVRQFLKLSLEQLIGNILTRSSDRRYINFDQISTGRYSLKRSIKFLLDNLSNSSAYEKIIEHSPDVALTTDKDKAMNASYDPQKYLNLIKSQPNKGLINANVVKLMMGLFPILPKEKTRLYTNDLSDQEVDDLFKSLEDLGGLGGMQITIKFTGLKHRDSSIEMHASKLPLLFYTLLKKNKSLLAIKLYAVMFSNIKKENLKDLWSLLGTDDGRDVKDFLVVHEQLYGWEVSLSIDGEKDPIVGRLLETYGDLLLLNRGSVSIEQIDPTKVKEIFLRRAPVDNEMAAGAGKKGGDAGMTTNPRPLLDQADLKVQTFDTNDWNRNVLFTTEISGGRIVVGNLNTTSASIWKKDDAGKYQKVGELSGHSNHIYSAFVMKDGKILTASQDRTAKIWNETESGFEIVDSLEGHEGAVLYAIELKNGDILTTSEDRTAKVWRKKDNKYECIDTLTGHTDSIFFALELADQRILTVGYDRTTRLWRKNESNYVEEHKFSGVDGHNNVALQLNDGRILLGSSDGNLRIVDKDSFEIVSKLSLSGFAITDIADLGNNRIIVTTPMLTDASAQIIDVSQNDPKVLKGYNLRSATRVTTTLEGNVITTSLFGSKVHDWTIFEAPTSAPTETPAVGQGPDAEMAAEAKQMSRVDRAVALEIVTKYPEWRIIFYKGDMLQGIKDELRDTILRVARSAGLGDPKSKKDIDPLLSSVLQFISIEEKPGTKQKDGLGTKVTIILKLKNPSLSTGQGPDTMMAAKVGKKGGDAGMTRRESNLFDNDSIFIDALRNLPLRNGSIGWSIERSLSGNQIERTQGYATIYAGPQVSYERMLDEIKEVLSERNEDLDSFSEGILNSYEWLHVKDLAREFDEAMFSNVGGIDLNAANLNLQIKRDGKGVPLPFAQQDMAQLSRITGFIPQFIEIAPAVNLPIISELRQRLHQ